MRKNSRMDVRFFVYYAFLHLISAMQTNGETKKWLPLTRELAAKLTEGEIPDSQVLHLLSLRQKSQIFATSLIRGRHE